MSKSNLTLDDCRAAFVIAVVKYLNEVCRMSGTHLGEQTARYMDWQWPIVEHTFKTGSLSRVDGNASDLTADFCCGVVARRI